MNTYTFIKSTHSENYPNPILAISIEIDSNIYDYSIYNQDSDAHRVCLKELTKKFKLKFVDDDLNDDDEEDYLTEQLTIQGGKINLENFEEEEIINFDRDEINNFIQKWETENAKHYPIKGFEFDDGSYWRIILVQDDVKNRNKYKIIENNSLEAEIDSKVWIKNGFGKKVYESNNYWIIHDYTRRSFAEYELYAKEEYDLEDININKIAVFHIGREWIDSGGYKTFKGFVDRFDYEYFGMYDGDDLMVILRDGENITDKSGNVLCTVEEYNSNKGTLDIDGEYDTYIWLPISELDGDDLKLIFRDGLDEALELVRGIIDMEKLFGFIN